MTLALTPLFFMIARYRILVLNAAIKTKTNVKGEVLYFALTLMISAFLAYFTLFVIPK